MTDRRHLQRRIQAEYREAPGLKLTAAQASRFWHLSPADSQHLLDSLVSAGALLQTPDGYYVLLADSHLA